MTDRGRSPDKRDQAARGGDLSRREFAAVSLGGLAVAAGSGSAQAALAVVEENVEIKTPDGTADAAFIHPATGSYPGVIIWTDIFGLRPTFRDMGKRLAAEGYSVLIPNPYYRTAKAPGVTANLGFEKPEERQKLMSLMGSASASGTVERDAPAYVDFLDGQPSVKKSAKIGTNGYCMGGPLTVRTAAVRPDRVGAGASFHGGSLVTDKPDSPHLLAPKIKARYYFAIAESDDKAQPDAKDKLKASFAAAHVPAEIEIYAGSIHGWCVPDMPMRDGTPIYNQALAERAWGHLLELYKTALV